MAYKSQILFQSYHIPALFREALYNQPLFLSLPGKPLKNKVSCHSLGLINIKFTLENDKKCNKGVKTRIKKHNYESI